MLAKLQIISLLALSAFPAAIPMPVTPISNSIVADTLLIPNGIVASRAIHPISNSIVADTIPNGIVASDLPGPTIFARDAAAFIAIPNAIVKSSGLPGPTATTESAIPSASSTSIPNGIVARDAAIEMI